MARLEVTDGRVVLVNSDRAVSTHRWLSPKDAGALPPQLRGMTPGSCQCTWYSKCLEEADRIHGALGSMGAPLICKLARSDVGAAMKAGGTALVPGVPTVLRPVAGAFTFSVPAEAGYGVEADPNPPRLMGAPFAADLHARHCYAILPGGQVCLLDCFLQQCEA